MEKRMTWKEQREEEQEEELQVAGKEEPEPVVA